MNFIKTISSIQTNVHPALDRLVPAPAGVVDGGDTVLLVEDGVLPAGRVTVELVDEGVGRTLDVDPVVVDTGVVLVEVVLVGFVLLVVVVVGLVLVEVVVELVVVWVLVVVVLDPGDTGVDATVVEDPG